MEKLFNIVKLYFREPIALMSEKKDEFVNEVTTLPSDMIKAALLSSLARVAPNEDIEKMNEDLIVSSAFLFYNDIYFFPKPMVHLPVKQTDNPKLPKMIKNIRYVEKDIFEKILHEQSFEINENNLLHNGKILVVSKDIFPNNLYKSQTEERVSIGNTNVFGESEKGSPYYISRTYFYKDNEAINSSGLYFIYQGDKDLLQKALDIWKEEGLGADRRLGNGFFDYRFSSFYLNVPEKANKQVVLSYYIPRKENIKNDLLKNASYLIQKRGGYISGTTREAFAHWLKKNILMLKDASVFDNTYQLEGKNVNLSTDKLRQLIGHDIYRDGRPVSIPLISNKTAD